MDIFKDLKWFLPSIELNGMTNVLEYRTFEYFNTDNINIIILYTHSYQ